MARAMVEKILDEGVPCAFVLADALYGSDYKFRTMLEEGGQADVLAVRSNEVLRFIDERQLVESDPGTIIGELEAQAWQPLPAGEGAKGPRLYDWARLPLEEMKRVGRAAPFWFMTSHATEAPLRAALEGAGLEVGATR